jgi:hypothetical protein
MHSGVWSPLLLQIRVGYLMYRLLELDCRMSVRLGRTTLGERTVDINSDALGSLD